MKRKVHQNCLFISQWLHDAFEKNKVKDDVAIMQLALSVVAVATTTELMTGVMIDLAKNPTFIKDQSGEISIPTQKSMTQSAFWSCARNRDRRTDIWQLVSTSEHRLSFGQGEHACPGRFFASDEIKTAMLHILLKYDWKFDGRGAPKDLGFGGEMIFVDGGAKILYRRRMEEIEL